MLKNKFKLLPHQQEAMDKLDKSNAILMYHGLGSGKTLSSIVGSSGYNTDVVVPAALRENYKKEVSNFTNSKTKRNVISYEGLSSGKHKYKYKGKNALVVDEVQRAGNADSKRAKSLMGGAYKYDRRILLSGTPAQNHPHELAPIIRMLNPDNKDVPLAEKEFKQKFYDNKTIPLSIINRLRGMKPGVTTSLKNQHLLQNAIKGRVHYQPSNAAGFPDRTDSIRKIQMSPNQTGFYKTVTKKANPMLAMKIKAGMPLSKTESKQLNAFMTAARQVSNTTKAYGGTEITPKIQAVAKDIQNLIKKNKKHKSIIYSNYIGSGIQEIENELKKGGISSEMYSGALNDKEKKQIITNYNTGKNNTLLLGPAGAEGLDLKGTRSIHIVDPAWNKSKIDQVIGRGIRFGSHDALPKNERNVKVIKYQSTLPKTLFQKILRQKADKGSDEYLYELSASKQKLLDQFLKVLKKEGVKK